MELRILGLLVAIVFSAAPVMGQPLVFDWLAVGDPGNAADTTGIGAVADHYRISRHEVTNAQYVEFLNQSDPSGANTPDLYNPSMASDVRGGISLVAGNPAGSKYVAKVNMGNKPVNYVSWYDAARFANWVNNGQGNGSTETGAYDMTEGMPTRLGGADIFLPSENEWYKAAYYDPVNAGADGSGTVDYWLYPTQSDTAPTPATSDPTGIVSNPGLNVANYNSDADWNGRDGNVTTVGSAGTTSFYGAYDMGGNVREWNETAITGNRGIRGSSWNADEDEMQSLAGVSGGNPIAENSVLGFRVAAISIPDTDDDGLNDEIEATLGTNPNDSDSDDDGLTDGQEVLVYGTNPLLKDSDMDNFNDLAEIQAGKDPNDINDTPDAVVNIYTSVEFEFFSQLGQDYQVQWSINLADWFTLPEVIPGTGDAIIRFYSTRTEPKRYFRAERVGP